MAEDDLSTPLLADNETSSPLLTENDTSLPLSTENDTSSPLPTENDTSSPLPTENVTSSPSDIKIKAENTTTTTNNNNPLDVGKMDHGCIHYRRRCKIRAPCCNQIYSCRHCHNEATSAFTNPEERHEIVRHDIKQVICELCSTEQQAAQICIKCGVKMGEYFCDICKFYEDDISKEQFHCNECGICRIGGREKFFHCKKCGSCYTITLRDNHPCVENSMKNQCPICYEFLFDSIKSSSILKCGHTMHMECQDEMLKHNQYRCPICLKSVLDMATTWQRVDEEIEATAMPEEYRYEVSILCSDCNNTSKTAFHIFGHKCSHCNSYNTRRIGPINESMERQIEPEDILP